MARVMIFALFDRKAREYGPPLSAANVPTMKRELQKNVGEGSLLQKYPDDFDLYTFAEMDTETGAVEVTEHTLVDNLRDILESGGV